MTNGQTLLLEIKKLEESIGNLTRLYENLEDNEPKSKKIFVIIDAGHGGNHPNTGKYMTPPHIGKLYKFIEANFEVREGVVNRLIADKFAKMLQKQGFEYAKIYHDYIDISLQERVMNANKIYQKQTARGKKVILLSFHSNAFGISAQGDGETPRGWSVWTTRGSTKSDFIAEAWYRITDKKLGNVIQMRKDISDKDFDYESNFYILFHTLMPAVIVENLFFTNLEDAKLLSSPEYQKESAICALETVEWAEANI